MPDDQIWLPSSGGPSTLTTDDLTPEQVREMKADEPPLLLEMGATGLKRNSGWIDEEFLPQLKGRKAVQIYREMAYNDPIIGALLFSIDQLVRNVEWTVKPGGKTKEDAQAADFLESCMEDMTHTWPEFVNDSLSALIYGWSFHEIVYKRRMGRYTTDLRMRSKHDDGMIGWRRLPVRSQESLWRWVFDTSGDVVAMVQMPAPKYQAITIPMNRGFLLHWRRARGNPEGISMLRNAYRPWYYKKRMEEYESIGVERDLAGLPVAKVPLEYMRAKPGTEQYRMVDSMKRMIRSVRRNEQEGIVFPTSYDQDTKQPLFNIELLGSGGGRAFSTDAIIRRYEERILMSVLADFVLVGHQQTGSYSLHTDKTGIFRTALNSISKNIAGTLNRTAVLRLFDVNGMRLESPPEIVASDVDVPDLAQLAQFMSSMGNLGLTWFPDGELEKFVRKVAKMPELDEDSEALRDQMNEMSEQSQLANAQNAVLQAKVSAQQMMMPPQAGAPGAPPGGGQPPASAPPQG